MAEPTTPIPAGTLWSRILEQTRLAEREGVLESIATVERTIDDQGVPFLVRSVSSLARKDRARRGPVPANPFLPPEPALTLGAVAPGHVAVLNKFNVIAHHLLLVTADFQHQEELLTPGDFQALWWGLGEFPSLGFYNGGEVAGASQPHKHLQLVPLPIGEGPDLPIDVRLQTDRAPEGEACERDLPFRHAFLRLPALAGDERAAEICHRGYRELLERVGLNPRTDLSTRQRSPYNLLMTRRFLFLVPRSREHFEGISVNALGFAGSLFVRDREQLDRVVERGPLHVLRSVVS